MAGERFIPGCVIVSFVMGTQDEEIQDLFSRHGLTISKHLKNIGVFVLVVPEGREQEFVDILSKESMVAFAILNVVLDD